MVTWLVILSIVVVLQWACIVGMLFRMNHMNDHLEAIGTLSVMVEQAEKIRSANEANAKGKLP